MHTYMHHVIRNCYITFTAKRSKKNERREVNEKFYKLERAYYRDCIKVTRDKNSIPQKNFI